MKWLSYCLDSQSLTGLQSISFILSPKRKTFGNTLTFSHLDSSDTGNSAVLEKTLFIRTWVYLDVFLGSQTLPLCKGHHPLLEIVLSSKPNSPSFSLLWFMVQVH